MGDDDDGECRWVTGMAMLMTIIMLMVRSQAGASGPHTLLSLAWPPHLGRATGGDA